MEAFGYKELAEVYFKHKNQEDIIYFIKNKFSFDSCNIDTQNIYMNYQTYKKNIIIIYKYLL